MKRCTSGRRGRVDPASTGWANAAPGWRQDQRDAPIELAKSVMAPSFQSSFDVVEGSARTDVSDEAFDACGKKAMLTRAALRRDRRGAERAAGLRTGSVSV